MQTTQTKFNGSQALIETVKIDHIWSKIKGKKYFSILDICSGYHYISIHPDSRPKQYLDVHMENFNGIIFLNLMFKLFFIYLDDILVFWMNDLLIYSHTEKELLQHLELVFKK